MKKGSLLQIVAELESQGGFGALCTVIKSSGSTPRRSGSKMLVYSDGGIEGSVGGGEMENMVIQEALDAIQENHPRIVSYELVDPRRGDPGVCGGNLEVYVEPINPNPTLVIVGAGHVGKAVAHLAGWLGYRVVVSDDRPEYSDPEHVPDADAYYPIPLSQLPEKITIHPNTYLVLTTRNAQIDIEGLPPILESPAAYIGVIGSKRRWETTRKALLKNGISDENLKKIVSPMGLELNAETPEEIALSIMAEIVMLRQGGDGKRMQE